MASNFLLCFCALLGVTVSQTTAQSFGFPSTSDALQGSNHLTSDDGPPSLPRPLDAPPLLADDDPPPAPATDAPRPTRDRNVMRFVREPQSQLVKNGGRAELACAVNTAGVTIEWLYGGKSVVTNSRNRLRQSDGTLVISKVKRRGRGEGMYQCKVLSDAGAMLSRPAQITIAGAEREFSVSPANVSVAAGGTALLRCSLVSLPPARIIWMRAGQPLPVNDSQRLAADLPGQLVIRGVTAADAGQYSANGSLVLPCVADGKPPPAVRWTRADGRLIRLRCLADGQPPPTVTWLKDGQRITVEGGRVRAKDGQLVITNVQTKDAGIYQCVAYNRAGYTATGVRIEMAVGTSEQVHAPTNVRVTGITSRSAFVSWSVDDRSQYVGFSLHYRAPTDEMDSQEVSNNLSLQLKYLQPFTNYSVYIRGYSGNMASDPSPTVTFVTSEDVPSQTPRVTLVTVSPTALNVSWEPLPPKVSNGVVTGYRIISQRYQDGNTASMVEVPGDRRSFLMTGLEPGGRYEVRVLAATRVGYQNVTGEGVNDAKWVVQRMPLVSSVSHGPQTPTVHLVVSNHSTIRIWWEMPSGPHSPPPAAFVVQYRRLEKNAHLSNEVRLPGNASEHYLTGLAPKTWYEVHVKTVSADERTAESIKTISTLPVEPHRQSGYNISVMLEPPVGLHVKARNATAVLVRWEQPPSARIIKYFTVMWHPLGRDAVPPSQLSSTSREVTVIGLEPYTYYEFSVRSHDAEGTDGPFSEGVRVRTLEGVPTPPANVTWSPLDASRILVRWRPPRSPHGQVSGYRVLYTADRDSPLDRWTALDIPASSGTQMQIAKLVPNQQYWVRVRARTATALGDLSDPAEFQIRAVLDRSAEGKADETPASTNVGQCP
ncbi:protogenin B-like [Pollicipes pollicipes]|uniref:protogenin B-like n=1 Tax=Pollicipes pollicipes TaxID=41117 RepID=UPI0018850956|nr:protogenin B-like [Pollicipes pollicipes]